MSKSFTASAILLLRDEGALALDDPAAAYVPELAGWANGAADAGPLTIRHLLTMTAGFPTDDPWGDRQQGLPLDEFRRAAGARRRASTGRQAPASSTPTSGYAILGLIVAAASGVPYDEFVRTRLLAPLGMTRTGFAAEEFPRRRARRRLPARPGRLGGAAVRPLRRVRPDGRRVLLRRRPGDLVRGVRGGVPAGRMRPRWPRRAAAGGRSHPLAAASRRLMQLPQAVTGWRAPDRLPGGPPGCARLLRLRAVRRRGPGARPGGQPQRRLPGLRVEHALAPGDRPRRHRARQRHLHAHVRRGRPASCGRCSTSASAGHVAHVAARRARARGRSRGRRPWRRRTSVSPAAARLGRRRGGRAVLARTWPSTGRTRSGAPTWRCCGRGSATFTVDDGTAGRVRHPGAPPLVADRRAGHGRGRDPAQPAAAAARPVARHRRPAGPRLGRSPRPLADRDRLAQRRRRRQPGPRRCPSRRRPTRASSRGGCGWRPSGRPADPRSVTRRATAARLGHGRAGRRARDGDPRRCSSTRHRRAAPGRRGPLTRLARACLDRQENPWAQARNRFRYGLVPYR